MLPLGLADEDAIARADVLSSKRKGPFDGWDGGRVAFSHPDPAKKPEAWLEWPAMSSPPLPAE
jgi:hypothetical protein